MSLRFSLFPFFYLVSLTQGAGADVFAPEQIEAFEKQIRPLLVERCYDCHGAHRHENGLRLDSRDAVLRGSDYGKVVEPGNPGASKLIHAVRGAGGAEKMPKKGAALSEPEVAALEKWIAEGLPWPAGETAEAAHHKTDPKNHWAFLPVVKPALPDGAAAGNAIDALVGAKLRAAGLDFAPEADAATLYRRLSLTLTGLQPEFEEVRAFAEAYASQPEAAWDKAVTELLASPHYGQKWARHWLDVARYSDTEGYQAGGKDIRFPYAYTYRNWVIEALNTDMPYDQFVMRQLAADRLISQETLAQASLGKAVSGDDSAEVRHLAALGFLTVNDRFLGDRLLQTDDRIDVVTRGLMGLTVGCARCHDHKYDPISSKDYYALYGVFNSSELPEDVAKPVIGFPDNAEAVKAYAAQVADVEARKQAFREEVLLDLRQKDRLRDYLVFAQKHLHAATSDFRGTAGREKMRDRIAESWREFIKWSVESEKTHPVMFAWRQFSALDEKDFAAKAADVVRELNGDPARCNPVVAAAFTEQQPAPKSLNEVAEVYAGLFLENAGDAQSEDKPREEIRALMRGGRSPMGVGVDRIEGYFTRKDRERMTKLDNEIKKLDIENPGAPYRAMAMLDKENPADQRVMIRGNPGRLGEPAPRAYLEFFGGEKFSDGSGRLELARKIAARDNPLTARVIVNRVWMHHFGKPLTDQPSDFGVQTPRPVQADVLDHLAAALMEEGWSLKKLHRLILTSRAWRQSGALTPEKALKDADNELISRMNRQRMDYEMLRDNLLRVAGRLNVALTPARSVPLNSPDADQWRSVLLFVDRYEQPTVPAMFDFANPDSHSPQRFVTTVPQQALFLMNSPFMKAQAEALAARAPVEGSTPDSRTVAALYQRVLLREPHPEEVELAQRFFTEAAELREAREVDLVNLRWDYGTMEIAPDAEGRFQAAEFKPFSHLDAQNKNRWSHTGVVPDPVWSFASLGQQSGHPGSGPVASAARWTAPRAMTVRLSGQVKRASDKGDGLRAFVVSGSAGVVQDVFVGPGKTENVNVTVKLAQGETVALAFGCEKNLSFDSFEWQLALHEGGALITDARRDFIGSDGWPLSRGKPQSPLAQFAQVLMMSNEFQFVD